MYPDASNPVRSAYHRPTRESRDFPFDGAGRTGRPEGDLRVPRSGQTSCNDLGAPGGPGAPQLT